MVTSLKFARPFFSGNRQFWKRTTALRLYHYAARESSMADMIEEPIEEELLSGGSRLKYFHPTQPGDILDGRFKTITKLGFGGGSTVWLAENLKFKWWKRSLVPRYVSIKIASLDTDASGEFNTSKLICNAEPSHEGLAFIRTPVDDFHLTGPGGTHLCLVYEPMRETLYDLRQRFRNQRLNLPLLKFEVFCLLEALDYLHTKCDLIHTDIKDDNIMVMIEKNSVLEDFVKFHEQNPPPKHVRTEDHRSIYLSQGDFGPLQGTKVLPQLADFNLAFPGLKGERGQLTPIQAHRYRAPEVFLGCPWTYSADIWNLGLLMWDLLEDISLFNRPAGDDGEYDAHVHLAQMIDLLGEPPAELIVWERYYRGNEFKRPLVNSRGKVCKTPNEFWGGPFFDEDNQIVRGDLLGKGPRLADTVKGIDGKDKELFLDFASSMLQWFPEKRKTAKELMEHPFFDSFYKDRAKHM